MRAAIKQALRAQQEAEESKLQPSRLELPVLIDKAMAVWISHIDSCHTEKIRCLRRLPWPPVNLEAVQVYANSNPGYHSNPRPGDLYIAADGRLYEHSAWHPKKTSFIPLNASKLSGPMLERATTALEHFIVSHTAYLPGTS